MNRKMFVGPVMLLLLSLLAANPLPAPNSGTSLSVDLSATVECNEYGTGDITVSYTVSSTAAADAATGYYTVNGGDPVGLPTIAAGNVTEGGGWTFDGRTKTASGSFTLSGLENGDYTIEVCFEQQGAEIKSDCTVIIVQVDCVQTEKCDQGAELFGEVVGNNNLCKSSARIEVQVKGLFGATASLTVKNPNSVAVYGQNTTRAGESCVYQWNLDPKDWGSAAIGGPYTFHVTGANSATFDFGADLVCSKPGKP